jgi:hypothetical protein
VANIRFSLNINIAIIDVRNNSMLKSKNMLTDNKLLDELRLWIATSTRQQDRRARKAKMYPSRYKTLYFNNVVIRRRMLPSIQHPLNGREYRKKYQIKKPVQHPNRNTSIKHALKISSTSNVQISIE